MGDKDKEDGKVDDAEELPDAEDFLLEQTQFFSEVGAAEIEMEVEILRIVGVTMKVIGATTTIAGVT